MLADRSHNTTKGATRADERIPTHSGWHSVAITNVSNTQRNASNHPVPR